MKVLLMIYLILGIGMYIYSIIDSYLLKNSKYYNTKWYLKILGSIIGVYVIITWLPLMIAGMIYYEIRYRKNIKKLHNDIEEILKDLPELE